MPAPLDNSRRLLLVCITTIFLLRVELVYKSHKSFMPPQNCITHPHNAHHLTYIMHPHDIRSLRNTQGHRSSCSLQTFRGWHTTKDKANRRFPRCAEQDRPS